MPCPGAGQPRRRVRTPGLLHTVWRQADGPESRHDAPGDVAPLRRRLEIDPSAPRHSITVVGSGYRFEP